VGCKAKGNRHEMSTRGIYDVRIPRGDSSEWVSIAALTREEITAMTPGWHEEFGFTHMYAVLGSSGKLLELFSSDDPSHETNEGGITILPVEIHPPITP
jgi:hypothetical protein